MIDQNKLEQLVSLGVNDAECGRIVGCSREYVRQFKIMRGLTTPEEYQERFRELYDQGLTDSRIAANTGHSVSHVATWRYKNGLDSNTKIKKAKEHEVFLNLYQAGMNDNEIARETRNLPGKIRQWRIAHGLLSNDTRGRKVLAEGN